MKNKILHIALIIICIGINANSKECVAKECLLMAPAIKRLPADKVVITEKEDVYIVEPSDIISIRII